MQIWKDYNKRTKGYEWRARFRLNNRTFRLKEETKAALLDVIAEVRSQENREKLNGKYNLKLETVSYIPAISEIFEKALPQISKHHQNVFAARVFDVFLSLVAPGIKTADLTQSHFQNYIDYRSGQVGKLTGQPIRRQTIYKELYAITSALRKGRQYFSILDKWQVPELPELPRGFKKKSKRERLVTQKELADIVAELIKAPEGKQTHAHHFHRVRLAHTLEFGYWTGLRRKELARLKFSQYDPEQQALLNVRRWKTDTVTRFFPLSSRAIEIVNARRELQDGGPFIFTPAGNPIESNYRTLKTVCAKLGVPYGRYNEDGFVSHDLRHNFGTEIMRGSDIETARELLGHANISQTGTYVHTSPERLRDAVRNRENIDYNAELKTIFEAVRNDSIDVQEFNRKIRHLFRF